MAEQTSEDISFNDFIRIHLYDNPQSILLKYHKKNTGFSVRDAVVQIESRQRARRKLSKFIEKEDFRFPSSLSAEQATHQCVAAYHAEIIGKGRSVADLTAGLGIDVVSFALKGNRITAVELDEQRALILDRNSQLWETEISESGGSIKVICADSLHWLEGCGLYFDVIYIDPSRRNANQKRVFLLSDCLPDVVSASRLLEKHSDRIIIKASPLLDISKTIEEMPSVSEIQLVCVNGECKEVLLIINNIKDESGRIIYNNKSGKIKIHSIDLRDNPTGKVEVISAWECSQADCNVPGPIAPSDLFTSGNWIYDPNSAIHKLRPAEKLCRDFTNLFQIGPNTDLYISSQYFPDFPGRCFKIEEIPSKCEMKSLKGKGYEVISRNYPLQAEEIKKRFKLSGSNDKFLIAIRAGKELAPGLYICRKQS